MKKINVRNDGRMVRYEEKDGFYHIDYSNGDKRLEFYPHPMKMEKEKFLIEFPLEMQNPQIIYNIHNNQLKFVGEDKEQSLKYFNY